MVLARFLVPEDEKVLVMPEKMRGVTSVCQAPASASPLRAGGDSVLLLRAPCLPALHAALAWSLRCCLLRPDRQLAAPARRHQLFLACGLTEDGAAQCTDVLLKNDLRGNESHGMSNSTSQPPVRSQVRARPG